MRSADRVRTIVLIAPNYQGGKDMLAGFESTYRGKVVDTILYKLGESDFQADLGKLRASKAEALAIFAPAPWVSRSSSNGWLRAWPSR